MSDHDTFVLGEICRKLDLTLGGRTSLCKPPLLEKLLLATVKGDLDAKRQLLNKLGANSDDFYLAIRASCQMKRCWDEFKERIDAAFERMEAEDFLAVPFEQPDVVMLPSDSQTFNYDFVISKVEMDRIQRNPFLFLFKGDPPKKRIKKENFYVSHIRALARAARRVSEYKIPHKGMLNVSSAEKEMIWEEMKLIYFVHEEEIDAFVKELEASTSRKSSFFQTLLSRPGVQQLNTRLCELIFKDEVQAVCQRMKTRCCREKVHSKKCELIWRCVEQYVSTGRYSYH